MKKLLAICKAIMLAFILLTLLLTSCQSPAVFSVTDLKLETAEVGANTPCKVTASVTNTGGTEGTYTATLLINGEKGETKDILVKPGTTETVVYTVTKSTPGDYEVAIGSQKQILKVKKPAEFAVTDLTVEPKEVPPGTTSTVSAKIANNGGSEGTYSATLLINGEKGETKDITVKPGDTQTTTFSVSRPAAGDYEIAVGSKKQKLTVFEMNQQLLRRDNGFFSRDWNYYDPRGQWVKFTPPTTPFTIKKILVRGKRTDFASPELMNYTIKIRDKDFSKELFSADYPYSKFPTNHGVVEHEIKPEVIVNGDFYVDFISHAQSPPAGETRARIAIFIQADFTTDTSEYAGLSWVGTIDKAEMTRLLKQEPRFAKFSWIIQVQGTSRGSASAAPVAPSPTPTPTPTPSPTLKPQVRQEIPTNIKAIMDKALAANTQWKTLKYNMDLSLAIDSTGGTLPLKANIIASGPGTIDNTNKQMQMAFNIKMDSPGQLNFDTGMELYITGGWMYTKAIGLWMKTKLTDDVWQSQQRTISQQAELLKTAMAVDLLDSENVDNIPCYVLQITPDFEALAKYLSQQQTESLTGLDFDKLNLSQVFKKTTVKEWIAKDTYQFKKVEIQLLIEVAGDISKDKFEKMTMDMSTAMKFSDYNKPVVIKLPPEASSAMEIPAGALPGTTPSLK